jgi:hypothetical protein
VAVVVVVCLCLDQVHRLWVERRRESEPAPLAQRTRQQPTKTVNVAFFLTIKTTLRRLVIGTTLVTTQNIAR